MSKFIFYWQIPTLDFACTTICQTHSSVPAFHIIHTFRNKLNFLFVCNIIFFCIFALGFYLFKDS